MKIRIPEFSMIVMVGATASGKSTLAARLFQDSEIISSDNCRRMIVDDPNNMEVSQEAFGILHAILDARLRQRRLTVVDATNLELHHRQSLLEIARNNDCHTTAILMETPQGIIRERNPGHKNVSEQRLRRQFQQMRRNHRGLRKEGFRQVIRVESQEDADELEISRNPMRTDLRHLKGPFDIIGDVHGCHDELMELLDRLGYIHGDEIPAHPEGRTAIFLGDLVDRGPAIDRVLSTVMLMRDASSALCLEGNHENKLLRKLRGANVQVSHGLAETLEQLEPLGQEYRKEVQEFLERLHTHLALDGGNLAVAHAGIREEYLLRASRRIREFCLYGDVDGERDEWGLPVRRDWAEHHRGNTLVVYGHTAVREARFYNNTICIDTGCVFGGSLTALRYPERELVSVPAHRTYYESVKPLEEPERPENREKPQAQAAEAATAATAKLTTGAADSGLPTVPEMTRDHEVVTRLQGRVRLERSRLEPALELVSRFTIDPRWLVYIPPTISPTMTSKLPDLLEHPAQAFHQYRENGVARVICEEKHMGSRGIVVLGRDENAIRRRFGFREGEDGGNPGACYTRTGRQFFRDPRMEQDFLEAGRRAVGDAGLWEKLETDWLLLDCEIMPWSLKAGGLLTSLYASTGNAAEYTLRQTLEALQKTAARQLTNPDVQTLLERTQERLDAVRNYREAYRRYCWEATSVDEVKTAPFHVLAAEGRTFADQPHEWHLQIADRLAQAAPGVFQKTDRVEVELSSPEDEEKATQWWHSMVQKGSEGMVVKPADFIPQGSDGRTQPAVKVRGPEYLRIIYGPEYLLPQNLERMRGRGLRNKQMLALREFALAQEGLERFVAGESPARVLQCTMGVLALEQEPTDPRL